jgi:uncharacterized membrane protein
VHCRAAILVLAALGAAATMVFAHQPSPEIQVAPAGSTDFTRVPTDSSAARFSTSPALDSLRLAEPPSRGHEPPFTMPPLREALFEHAHNAIVHFPIAFTFGALGLTWLGRTRPGFAAAAQVLLLLAALGATAAYFSGRIQAEHFAGKPKEWLVQRHETLGIASALGLWIWLAILSWEPARRYAWLPGVIVAALIGISAFYGGVVAHAH